MRALRAESPGRRASIHITAYLMMAALFAAIMTTGAPARAASANADITVCPTCDVRSIAGAIKQAAAGTRIDVQAGTYPGDLLIDRPVTLTGTGNPVIAGGDSGTVVRITAPNVTLQGFTIRGSGISLDREDSAVAVEAGSATIKDNLIQDALFGIYLKKAPGTQIINNRVEAKPLPQARRGDGIRIWYSDDVAVSRNTVRGSRDVILWFSHRGNVTDNVIEDGRYGLHLMFSDQATIERNSFRRNSVGLYIMYSRDPVVIGNTLADNSGTIGSGLGLKDVDNARIEANRFVNNEMGAQIDDSPRELNARTLIVNNVFAYNNIGIGFLPNTRNNTLTGNAFIDNLEHVSVLGGGTLRQNTWTVNGKGNYWSDYVGYDANRDGVGDVPYQSRRLFESLMDRHPAFRLFLFSPAATAIDFAARAFPAVRPESKLEDNGPLTRPPASAALPPVARTPARDRLLTGTLSLFATIGALLMIGTLRRRRTMQFAAEGPGPELASEAPAGARIGPAIPNEKPKIVSVHNLTKRYGRSIAVDNVDFEVGAGEALALWGPNGAGKTTILRCVLGLARYQGDVRINGLAPDRDGRAVRRLMGFVPQELSVPPSTVNETARFIAALKRAPAEDAIERLRLLRIDDQLDKPVAALSGGMKQRLALALALIGQPDILLLDEPTANLDARGRAELLELLRQLKRQGMTFIFTSHRPEDVLFLADRILLIERGVIQRETTPSHFLDEVGAQTHLVLYLPEGQLEPALDELEELGINASGEGTVLTVPVPVHQKAAVIGALAKKGVVIEDFEVERGPWTGQP